MDSEILLVNNDIKKKRRLTNAILLSIIIVLIALISCFIILFIKEKNKTKSFSKDENKSINLDGVSSNYQSYIPLSSWYNCDAKTKLSQFISKINSAENYVKKEDRIAVFDFDGTLFQETDPIYNDYKLYYYRVKEDSHYSATDEQKAIADEIKKSMENYIIPNELIRKVTSTYPDIFKDLTVEQYQQYIKDFVDKPSEGYENMKRGDAFYKPMLEIIEFLQKNDFNVYINSGAERYQLRAMIDGHIDIPPTNIIGSEYDIVATNQGDIQGHEYTYQNEDDFSFNNSYYRDNYRTNKIIGIIREIGKHPILLFGNSDGDSDMAKYVMNNKKYPSLAFMICCDDTDRERGDEQKAEKMRQACQENGWVPISMKKDWITIYGENVKKKTNN